MNETPTPIGVSSLWEDLEKMITVPELPSSALVTQDGGDVFVSFHWESKNRKAGRLLALLLTEWLKDMLVEMGAHNIEEYYDGFDENEE